MTALYYLLRQLTRPAYRIQGIGLGRLCEAVRRWAAKNAPSAPLPIDDFWGDARFNCYLKEHMGGQIFFRGSYSGEQLSFLEKHLSVDSVFIDAGANQGEFSIVAARVALQGRVIAFEPVAEYRARLKENARLNGFVNIEVVPTALGEQTGELPIYDAPHAYADGTRNEGLPTLFASESRNRTREVVEVRKLDDMVKELGLSRVDVIKLDIEGAEWMALRGAAETLARFRPLLILEIGRETCRAAGHEPEALVNWLTGLGYRIEKITRGGQTVPMDATALDGFQNVAAFPS